MIVLDTHIWIWWVHGDDKLPSKHKHNKVRPMSKYKQPISKPGGIALAAAWPIYEVLLSEGWDQEASLITTLIARRSPKSGKVAAGLFLVDLACLGVKSVQVKLFKDTAEYAGGLRAHAQRVQRMAPASFDLAVKIILTGLDYAAALGFRPDPVFAQAQPLLEGAHPEAVDTPVSTGGPEGKPFFVNGPYDDARKIVDHLTRTVGAGNFHYLVQVGEDETDLPGGQIMEDVDDQRQLGQ